MTNSNTGDSNTGYLNTGNRNTGNRNTGNSNTGDWNTGNRNIGNSNTGNWNTDNRNTGNSNTGYLNTGNSNTGNWNTGNSNTGNSNTGNWNTGDWNTGYLNTNEDEVVRIFNKITSVKRSDINFPDYFYIDLAEWTSENDMTEKEKEAYPSYVTTRGYLKRRTYKQAWREKWDKATKEDRKKTLSLPNWDNEIFKEISGIDVEKELNKKHEIIIDGKTIELSEERYEKLKESLI